MFFIPGQFIALLTFPGVVIHELAHQLFCRYLKVPVYHVCYFQLANPAGYVIHGGTSNWMQNVLIGAGPFFLNSLLGAFLAFPSALRAMEFASAVSILDCILLWLGISIAMHAIPSTGDAKNMWQAVAGNNASFLAKAVVAPIVGMIVLLSMGSVVWMDAMYAWAVCFALPAVALWILA